MTIHYELQGKYSKDGEWECLCSSITKDYLMARLTYFRRKSPHNKYRVIKIVT